MLICSWAHDDTENDQTVWSVHHVVGVVQLRNTTLAPKEESSVNLRCAIENHYKRAEMKKNGSIVKMIV